MQSHTEATAANQAEASVPAQAGGEGAARDQPGDAQLVKTVAELASHVRSWDNGRLDADSEQGRRGLRLFLSALHIAGSTLNLARSSRGYRRTLSDRLRATWTDAESLYHVGVMATSANGEVYFNSRAYPLSGDGMALACQLCERLSELRGLLDRLHGTGTECVTASDVAVSRARLTAFDKAWAAFEERLFVELPGIESQALARLTECVGLVSDLDRIAGNYEEDVDPNILLGNPEFFEKHSGLIRGLARLSSQVGLGTAAASFSHEVLRQAEALVEDFFARVEAPACSIFSVAADAVRAWDDICCYLFELADRMDRVSPDLGKNETLVKLLEAWSTSWARAEAYIVDEQCSLALRTTLECVQKAKTVTPALVGMLDDKSAELFLVLPRLVLLCFLENPRDVQPLMARLLPHRFEELCNHHRRGLHFYPGNELAVFMDAYRRTWNLLSSAASSAAGPERRDTQTFVQAALTSSIVEGMGDTPTPATEGIFDGPAGRKAREACKSFVNKLEGWSMELQRHCATDWNDFSETLVRCLEPQAATTSAT